VREIVRDFARDVAENLPVAEPVVEIGARAAPGQEDVADVRGIFGAATHIGCDIQPGPGVDRIEDVHALSFADESVGTVLAFETLEHVADPIRAMAEIHRVLRPGGLVAISSVMFFPIHEHPWDFWRFTPEGFERLLAPFESRLVVAVGWELMPESVFGVGVKGPFDGLGPERLPRIAERARTWAADLVVDFGPIRLSVRDLWRHALRYSVVAARRRAARLRGRASAGRP
jgi:SAM-dependent methyltransferase